MVNIGQTMWEITYTSQNNRQKEKHLSIWITMKKINHKLPDLNKQPHNQIIYNLCNKT